MGHQRATGDNSVSLFLEIGEASLANVGGFESLVARRAPGVDAP